MFARVWFLLAYPIRRLRHWIALRRLYHAFWDDYLALPAREYVRELDGILAGGRQCVRRGPTGNICGRIEGHERDSRCFGGG